MVTDPRAVAARWPEPRLRAIADLACVATEAPWALSRAHHERARAAGLSDDEVLHALALTALFGHLNRIADAVDVPLDYRVRREPPPTERAVPPFLAAPAPVDGAPVLDLARRPATAAALDAWMAYAARPSPALDAAPRAMIAAHVRRLLGAATDAATAADADAAAVPAPTPRAGAERALLALAELITLAPWKLDAAAYAPLRAAGLDDRGIFDACAVASAAGVRARIDVAVRALGR